MSKADSIAFIIDDDAQVRQPDQSVPLRSVITSSPTTKITRRIGIAKEVSRRKRPGQPETDVVEP